MSKNRYPRLLGLVPLLGTLLLGGCNMTLLNPTGQVGLEQRNLIITATLLMLLVVVPVIVMTFLFAWKYRASNKNAIYTPEMVALDQNRSGSLDHPGSDHHCPGLHHLHFDPRTGPVSSESNPTSSR